MGSYAYCSSRTNSSRSLKAEPPAEEGDPAKSFMMRTAVRSLDQAFSGSLAPVCQIATGGPTHQQSHAFNVIVSKNET